MNKGIKTKYGKPLLEWEDLECYVKEKLESEGMSDNSLEQKNDGV